ncbi:MAG: hypothetical protein WC401_12070 [Bacteroidales bacterium]|jgi:hypothetical protein
MAKKYLKHGDRAFCTGCYLRYDEKENCFRFDGLEDDTFFDGKLVNFEDDKPFTEE